MSNNTLLESQKIHTTYRSSLLQLADTLSHYPFLRKKENELRAIADNLSAPFNIAIFGRMKTGKSTLINALIGQQLTITGAEEATATINRISYATGDKLQQFTVHWQDSLPESFPLEHLQSAWNGKEPEVLERVSRTAWLDLYSDAPALKDIHITDTPGTGATAAEHEKIAKQFINGQEADALLYVFSPTGRESDEADLEAFRAGCLPGSSLDNSIAVLHKWDHIYWDEDDWSSILAKSSRVHLFMQDLVSAVIPVSAPLALLAKRASPVFWQNCRSWLHSFDNEKQLFCILSDEDEWDGELEKLYQQAKRLGCKLPSFRIMLRHLFRNPAEEPAICIYRLSNLKELETRLDCQIFSAKSIIRQKQNCARARKVMNDVYGDIETELEKQQQDIEMLHEISKELGSNNTALNQWVLSKYDSIRKSQSILKYEFNNLDMLRIKIKDWSDTITNAHDLISWLKQDGSLPKDTVMLFISYLKSLLPNTERNNNLTIENLIPLLPHISRLEHSPEVAEKTKAQLLRKCLMQWYNQHLTA